MLLFQGFKQGNCYHLIKTRAAVPWCNTPARSEFQDLSTWWHRPTVLRPLRGHAGRDGCQPHCRPTAARGVSCSTNELFL